MSKWEATELGVDCSFPESFTKKLGNQWDVTKKLVLPRTFSLLSAALLVKEFDGIGMTAISCIDAVPNIGVSGLSWSKHLAPKVSVTINAKDAESKQTLEENIVKNNLNENDITVLHQDTNSLLHSEKKYNFVYLEAYGTTVRYLEAACRAVCHKGIICLVSTDLSTLYNKCPSRIQRLYYGNSMKHEYSREFAARLIIASVARAASRWDKGIDVLCTYVDGDSVTIIVRILKGATHADKCLSKIQKVVHCRICSYRKVLPEKLYFAPSSDVEKCLCDTNEIVNGDSLAPIVLLGPVYTGNIFNTRFLLNMTKTLSVIQPDSRYIALLKDIVVESMCFNCAQKESDFIKMVDEVLKKGIVGEDGAAEPPAKRNKSDDEVDTLLSKFPVSDLPIFYYVGQVHTKRGFNPPKIQEILHGLRSQGYKASKTLFDPRGVRTSADPKEFHQALEKISKQTS